ncbi:rhodanese-like domain-containing protein [Comamonas sp.]|uniref:rhodanese-like domain-containing protein n=1 Tax=Comamonas sp. TaxID=34028 RepID=UPI00289CC924|nr:rhodanese-like domain-containing protein [Comamonas sp.]
MTTFRHLAVASALLASSWLTAAHAAQPLLSPAELASAQQGAAAPVVIDIREPKLYAEGHIPGALNAAYGKWRGPATNPGELPDLPKLTALVQSLGLTPATHAVVVSTGADATDFGAMARVYWSLKVLGLKELSIVNGGMKTWVADGKPVSTEAPQVQASSYQPVLDESLIATRDQVRSHVDLSNAALVDSRPDAFYQGKTRAPAAKLSGTLPGAQQLDFNQWFVKGTAQFVDPATARQIADKVSRKDGQDTVAFCNTGHWAATDWFGLSEMAGLPNVKLYAGSMVDWTQQPGAPAMENQPGRAESLAYDAKQWWQRKFK